MTETGADQDGRIENAFDRILLDIADSSGLTQQQRIEIGEELTCISKFVEVIWEMMDRDVLFTTSVPHALHQIAGCADNIRMMLASAMIARDPGALSVALRLRESARAKGESFGG